MKKLVLLSFLLATLSQLSMGQNMDDDLYFVPKKEKKEKVTKVVRDAADETVTVITQSGEIRRVPADEVVATVSNGKLKTVTKSPDVVADASGVERNVDEYNRRYVASNAQEDVVYVEEIEEDEGEWLGGFVGSQEEYEYATRLIRFRSPRVSVPVSNPLYWDIVYSWSPFDWNIYVDGYYAYAFPTVANPAWWNWHYDPFYWNYSWNWNYGWGGYIGWNDPWYYHSYYYPSWGYYPHHHHGPAWIGGGGHLGGSWRDGFYRDNRRRVADRPNAVRNDRPANNSVRATRGNDRGTSVSSRDDANRTTGRVVAGRNNDNAVRSTTPGRDSNVKEAVPANGRASRNTINSGNSTSTSNRSTGSYTRSSNNSRSSERSTTNSGVRSSNSSTRSSSGNVSRSNNSNSSAISTRSTSGSSSRSTSTISSGSSSSRSSSGGGASRSGGGRR